MINTSVSKNIYYWIAPFDTFYLKISLENLARAVPLAIFPSTGAF